jgi:hypothetical protein
MEGTVIRTVRAKNERDTTAQSFLELLELSHIIRFGPRHCLRSNVGHISGHVEWWDIPCNEG